jgi:hypothetical protein
MSNLGPGSYYKEASSLSKAKEVISTVNVGGLNKIESSVFKS